MAQQSTDRWTFHLHCPKAQQVYLVIADEAGANYTVPMEPVGHDRWRLEKVLPEGMYDFHYFVSDGHALVNFGSHGLHVTRCNSPTRENTPSVEL